MGMKRKRGNLPGRYVPAHLRRSRYHPGEYDEVSAYQERTQPPPSKTELLRPQGDFESLWHSAGLKQKQSPQDVAIRLKKSQLKIFPHRNAGRLTNDAAPLFPIFKLLEI
jgi:hypothetical protein